MKRSHPSRLLHSLHAAIRFGASHMSKVLLRFVHKLVEAMLPFLVRLICVLQPLPPIFLCVIDHVLVPDGFWNYDLKAEASAADPF